MRSPRLAGACLVALLACVAAVSVNEAPSRQRRADTPTFEVPFVDDSAANSATVPTAEAETDASLLSVEERVLAQTAVQVKGNDPLAPYVVIPPFTCKPNTILADGTIIAPTQSFTYSFWIRPNQTVAGWSNIFHYGEGAHARTPSVFLWPGSLRLHVRISTSRGWNDGVDPVHHLKMGRWNFVAIVVSQTTISVYINKHAPMVATIGMPNVKSSRLFGSDPWHAAAVAQIKDLRYFARAISAANVKTLYLIHGDDAHELGDIEPGVGKVVFRPEEIEQPSTNQYSYSFWIFPRGIDLGWQNIFHHGDNNWQRSPALWFYPQQPRIHFRVSTHASWNEGVDPSEYLPMGRWTHVTFTARHGLMRVFYNGVLKAQAGIHTPVYHRAVTFASDPWHHDGRFFIKSMKYYTRELQPNEVPAIMHQSSPLSYRDFGAVEPRHAQAIADTGSLRNSASYTYAFWIRPHNRRGDWSSVLHRSDFSNLPTPGVQFQAGTTRLQVTAHATGTVGSLNPAQELPLHRWTHVAFSVRAGEFKLYFNGVVVGRQNIGTPVVHAGRLWAGNPWQAAAECSLADLRVYSKVVDDAGVLRIFREGRNRPSFQQVAEFPLVRARILASPQQIVASDAYTYTFWVRPQGLEHNWGNIFHHGNHDMQRNPGIWFYPGNTRLHIRTASVHNWNDGVDTPPHEALAFGKWSHVAVAIRSGDMRVFIDGELVAHHGISPVIMYQAPLFASHRDYLSGKADIRDFRHYTRWVHQNEVHQIIAANSGANFINLGSFIPRQGAVLTNGRPALFSHHGRIHSYSYSLWIRAHGTHPHWSNVFHHGGHNMERSPAMWFYPGSTRLHIRTSSPRDRNNGADPSHNLPIGRWVHIAIVVSKTDITVFWDGQHAVTTRTDGIHMDWGVMWGSDPWHAAAPCTVAGMRYYPNKLLSAQEVVTLARDSSAVAPAFRLQGPHNLSPGAVLAQAQQIPSAESYTWMFWIMPNGVPSHWGSILHHGDWNHERSPAIWLIPGTTRLHVRVATQFDHNNGIDTGASLTVNRWTHVAVVAREYDLFVYFDGAVVAARHFPFRLVCHSARTFSTDPWHGHMSGRLADVRYYPRAMPQHEVVAIRNEFGVPFISLGSFIPRPHLVLNHAHTMLNAVPYSYTFWIRPHGTFPHWTNLFHVGNVNHERVPAVFLYPGSTRLHIRTGDSGSWNSGFDPEPALPLRQWTHVAIIVQNGQLEVIYNGNQRWAVGLGTVQTVVAHTWGSDPWHHVALANVADLRYYPRALPASEVLQVRNENYVNPTVFIARSQTPVQQGRQVGGPDSVLSDNTFSYTFWIRPWAIGGDWRNIIHHGHHDGQRSPAIWFWPGNYNLHVRVSSQASWNDGIDIHSHGHIWYHRWTHVAVCVGRGELKVYLDGQLRGHRGFPQVALHHAPLWASNPWYNPAMAHMSDLRHYKYELTHDEVVGIVQQRQII